MPKKYYQKTNKIFFIELKHFQIYKHQKTNKINKIYFINFFSIYKNDSIIKKTKKSSEKKHMEDIKTFPRKKE